VRRAARGFLTALAALILGAQLIAAEAPASAFDAANTLYGQGRFAEAAEAYGKIIESGEVSPVLYFNLGNAFYKSGQMGRAIASYRRAERLAPRDPELRVNLQFVRNQVQGPTLAPGRWQRWLSTLTLNEWTALAMAALWLWLGLLIVVQWRPQWKPALRNQLLVTGVAAGLLAGCLAAAYQAGRCTRVAVVTVPGAVVRNSPLDESPEAFGLKDGAEMAVLDRKDNWLQIAAGQNRSGWIRLDQVAPPDS
jgi:tetratricopeptide (TPR) repeat protein